MAALNGITVIQGKPTVSPQLMLSLINRSGQLENLELETGTQGATVTMKRRGRSPSPRSLAQVKRRRWACTPRTTTRSRHQSCTSGALLPPARGWCSRT
ncbi:hypothetical protein ACFSC4_18815 [Deinococcus malanensis]|uniref:hypothetical protein n=1 Tax=Deinococcus malanensis TaxID=1706855 RepID=UPI0036401000